jgi:hypothetical protein
LGGAVVGYSAFRLFSKNKDDEESHLHVQVEDCRVFHETMTGALIRAGHRLDIRDKLLQSWGPISVAEVAQKTGVGWSERWHREFLLQTTAAKICEYQRGKKFQLRAKYVKFLRGPSVERRPVAGMFQFLSTLVKRTDVVVQAVKTSVGVDYDFGEDINPSSLQPLITRMEISFGTA